MPKRMLVDAMNVLGSKPDNWWRDRKRAMRSLVVSMDRYARDTGDQMTVVLDSDPGSLPRITNVEVVVASRTGRNAADREIIDLLAVEKDPSQLWVVTSDKELREQVQALGAQIIPSKTFRDGLDDATAGEVEG